MRREIILFVALIFVYGLISSFVTGIEDVEVGEKVLDDIKENGKANVIVTLEGNAKIDDVADESLGVFSDNSIGDISSKNGTVKFTSGGFAVEVNKSELNELIESGVVENIESNDIQINAFGSMGLINATLAWILQENSFNLTGINQTICIIDTGINYTHRNIAGRNMTGCNIDCLSGTCSENCTSTDYNGHGTHVAGIAAASGSLSGVAGGAGVIGVRIFPGTSSTGASVSNLKSAIDWCVDNSATYSISVISMSLGTDAVYSSNCDSSFSTLNVSITNAYNKNISVVVATGNSGSTTGISSPACISRAIPVGWSDEDDSIDSSSNRNILLKLFAPGNNINSSYYNGEYAVMSGTSMATPHVSGAIAILNQYLNLTSKTKTPKEIEGILNNTGKRIVENGINYSRINVYDALMSMDSFSPNVSLISPIDTDITSNNTIVFKGNASDLQLSNYTFYLWDSSNNIINQSIRSIAGQNANIELNVTINSSGSYHWNFYAGDNNINYAFSASNFSLFIGNISTRVVSPSNNSFLNVSNFTCLSETSSLFKLTNVTFYLWNSTGLFYNETRIISGTSNITSFNYTILNDFYSWACVAVNNGSQVLSTSNYTATYDNIFPNVTLNYPADSQSYTSNSQEITFNYNLSETNIANCSLLINDIEVQVNISTNETQNIVRTFTPASYNWSINCLDKTGNLGSSSNRRFTVTAVSTSTNTGNTGGSSGGGGGGTAYTTYTFTEKQAEQGIIKEIAEKDKIKFSIINSTHYVTLNKLTNTSIQITIASEPINLTLTKGESKRVPVDGKSLIVKFEDIINGKAKIVVQLVEIRLPAIEDVETSVDNSSNVNESAIPQIQGEDNNFNYDFSFVLDNILYILLAVFVIAVIVVVFWAYRKIIKKS